MRRSYWLLVPFLFWACSDDDDDNALDYEPITAIRVTPEAFLGDQACRDTGGLQRYQATLIDVTSDLNEAFTLPSSRVISCNSAVSFVSVQAGRRYMATVAAFDRSDIRALNPGSPIIVDSAGKSVIPRWTTTCWGDDRIDYSSAMGMGGVSGTEDDGANGAGGEIELGVLAYEQATITVRGCDELTGDGEESPTGVSIDIEPALLGLECGSGPGQIESFTVYAKPQLDSAASVGGAGGMGSGGAGSEAEESLGTAKCGEELTIEGLIPNQHTSFFVDIFSADEFEPGWNTVCTGLTIPGVIVPTSCDPVSD